MKSAMKWFSALLLMALVMVVMPGVAHGADGAVAAEEGSKLLRLWESTGLYGFFNGWWQQGMMILIGILLIYLGIAKKFDTVHQMWLLLSLCVFYALRKVEIQCTDCAGEYSPGETANLCGYPSRSDTNAILSETGDHAG